MMPLPEYITEISGGLYMIHRPRSISLTDLRNAVEESLPKHWRPRLIALRQGDLYGVCFYKEI